MVRMLGAKKAFTVIEAVVTIAVLSVVIGVSTLAISNLTNVQRGASTEVARHNEVDAINDVASSFVSFVGLDTDSEPNGLSFALARSSVTTSQIVYTCKTYTYTLAYNQPASAIAFSTNAPADASPSYLRATGVTAEKTLKNVTDIEFSFDTDISLLILRISFASGEPYRLSYIVRVAS